MLNFGLRREWLTRNVVALIAPEDLPKATEPEPTALDENEALRRLEEAHKPTHRAKKRGTLTAEAWFHPAVAFSLYTGARRGEVLGVRWSDVNMETAAVAIRRSLAETRSRGLYFKEPKNRKARTIALPSGLVAILKRHRQRQEQERDAFGKGYKDNDLVFARVDGLPIKAWNYARAVRDLALRAGVRPITLHDLRDTHASVLATRGAPLEVVSKRLGHSSIGITAERYLFVYQDRDRAAASVFDTLGGAAPSDSVTHL